MSMDDLLEPPFQLDGTTSTPCTTPCISTASSFVTASSFCGDADEIFQFDPFSEPFRTEVRSARKITVFVVRQPSTTTILIRQMLSILHIRIDVRLFAYTFVNRLPRMMI